MQIRNWSDDLISTMLPHTNTEWEELEMWQSRDFQLSPKDHWEVNGMLDYLQEWNRLESASILAVFGPTEDCDTWVTEFSLDMIQAFRVQDLLVTFAMCDRPADQIFTPTMVIKKIICQLLEQRPELIVEAPDLFRPRVFLKVTDFDEACRLLSSIVSRLSTSFAVILDRIDCCQPDTGDSEHPGDLVGFLSELLKEHTERAKIIITSGEVPPENEDLPSELPISICMINTRKRPLHKDDYCRGIRRRPRFDIHIDPTNEYPAFHRRVVGVEQLYKFRWLMDNAGIVFGGNRSVRWISSDPDWELSWEGRLRPRTSRERMIYQHFWINDRG